jgi:hypothetical protein
VHDRLDGFQQEPEDPPLSMHSALAAGEAADAKNCLMNLIHTHCGFSYYHTALSLTRFTTTSTPSPASVAARLALLLPS